MSRWNGPAGKGAMRKVRLEKRQEAEIRQTLERMNQNIREEREKEERKRVYGNLSEEEIEAVNEQFAIDLLKAIFGG